MRQFFCTIILCLVVIALHGQTTEEAFFLVKDTLNKGDSIVIELTDLQKGRLANLKKQIENLQQEYAEFVHLIADANYVDKRYSQITLLPDKLIFREPENQKK